ncbi:MAG: hypothetical protein BWY86_00670 [Candidatus Aminicenantes bacterium ADurb.Bin508]|nr:MAG: hypothetical protein BWY86_00670 [Candidatus Aminicenantes bacterium ADurb.Bin508]
MGRFGLTGGLNQLPFRRGNLKLPAGQIVGGDQPRGEACRGSFPIFFGQVKPVLSGLHDVVDAEGLKKSVGRLISDSTPALGGRILLRLVFKRGLPVGGNALAVEECQVELRGRREGVEALDGDGLVAQTPGDCVGASRIGPHGGDGGKEVGSRLGQPGLGELLLLQRDSSPLVVLKRHGYGLFKGEGLFLRLTSEGGGGEKGDHQDRCDNNRKSSENAHREPLYTVSLRYRTRETGQQNLR